MLIVIIRSVLLYILIMLSLRLMGKRQLGELQPSELVVTILISNIASWPIEDSSIPMIMGIAPILTLVCIDVFISGIMLKSHRFRRLVSGNPKIIISNGKIDQHELRELRYSVDDVLESMRENMIFDINEIQYAIVETTGKINFYQKQEYRTVINKDSGISLPKTNPPSVVIRDGEVDTEGLREVGFNENWLKNRLDERKLDVRDVFIMTADSDGTVGVVTKEAKR